MKAKLTAAALTIAAITYAGTAHSETREQCLGYTSGAIFSALTKNKCGFEIISPEAAAEKIAGAGCGEFMSKDDITGVLILTNAGFEKKQKEIGGLNNLCEDILKDVFKEGVYTCPEDFTTEEERIEELAWFISSVTKVHPKWTAEQLIAYRVDVLKQNKCGKTLSNIRGEK